MLECFTGNVSPPVPCPLCIAVGQSIYRDSFQFASSLLTVLSLHFSASGVQPCRQIKNNSRKLMVDRDHFILLFTSNFASFIKYFNMVAVQTVKPFNPIMKQNIAQMYASVLSDECLTSHSFSDIGLGKNKRMFAVRSRSCDKRTLLVLWTFLAALKWKWQRFVSETTAELQMNVKKQLLESGRVEMGKWSAYNRKSHSVTISFPGLRKPEEHGKEQGEENQKQAVPVAH